MKISTLMISLVLVSLFLGVGTLMMADGATNYGVTFDDGEFQNYNKFEQLLNDTEDIRENTEGVSSSTTAVDRIGAFFEAGYSVIKSTFKSLDITKDIVSEGVEDANLGVTAQYFNYAAILIVAISFIFIVISLIMKKDT